MRESQLGRILSQALRESDKVNIYKTINMGADLLYKDGQPLRELIAFKLKDKETLHHVISGAKRQGMTNAMGIELLKDAVRAHYWELVGILYDDGFSLAYDGYALLDSLLVIDAKAVFGYLAIDSANQDVLNRLFESSAHSSFGDPMVMGQVVRLGANPSKSMINTGMRKLFGAIRAGVTMKNAGRAERAVEDMALLLNAGGDPNAFSGDILSDVASLNHPPLTQLFIKHGASWSLMKPAQETFDKYLLPHRDLLSLHSQNEFSYRYRQMLAQAMINDGLTVMDVAKKYPDMLFDVAYAFAKNEGSHALGKKAFAVLREQGCEVHNSDPRILLFLTRYGEFSLQSRLLNNAQPNINVINKALQQAVWNNHLTAVENLIESGASLNYDPHVTLMYAKGVSNAEMMKTICDGGINLGLAKIEWKPNEHRGIGMGGVDERIVQAAKRTEIERHENAQSEHIRFGR